MTFKDHFSERSSIYAAFRPRYPRELFAFLAGLAPSRRTAWDCATGSGQAALGLALEFDRVIATDASAAQLAEAAPHPRIEYRLAPAESSGLADASIDLVTVAQAAHWLDLTSFFAEARRALVPGGVIALWCYVMCRIEPAIDAVVDAFYRETVGPFWLPERALVEDGYRSIEFPFEEIAAPDFAIEEELTLDRLAGYVRSWSATSRFTAERGWDPVERLVEDLSPLWRDPDRLRMARWPLLIRVGRRT